MLPFLSSAETRELIRHLHQNHVFTIVYLVTDEMPENLPTEKLPGVEIITIPYDAELTEVIG